MIVSKDEFLLLVQKWKNSSASVRLVMVHSGGTEPRRMSTSLMIELEGTIVGVDTEESLIVFSVGNSGLVSIGFDDSLLIFGTASELPLSFAHVLAEGEEVEEMVSICLPSNQTISLFTLRQIA